MALLKDKVIIVIGGAGRLGSEFAEKIIQENATCIIADISKGNAEETTLKLVKAYSEIIISSAVVDTSDILSIERMIKMVSETYGKIDGVINTTYPKNANLGRKFEKVTYFDFCENMNLHLGSYFLVAQRVCEYFKKQGFGSLINISSILGVSAPKFDTYESSDYGDKEMTCPVEYSLAKAAIIHLAKYLAKYYRDNGIRINTISPGGIYSGQPEGFVEKYKKYCTLKGMLDPKDISGTVIFLLSDLASYINGQNIIVDDGWSL